jgi:hypothetical protein
MRRIARQTDKERHNRGKISPKTHKTKLDAKLDQSSQGKGRAQASFPESCLSLFLFHPFSFSTVQDGNVLEFRFNVQPTQRLGFFSGNPQTP